MFYFRPNKFKFKQFNTKKLRPFCNIEDNKDIIATPLMKTFGGKK